MEQRSLQIAESHRITEVERRVSIVEVRQGSLETTVTKMGTIMEALSDKSLLNDAAIVAIRERTDAHNEQIKELTKGQVAVDVSLKDAHSKIGVIWKVFGTIGGATVLVTLEYIFAHFFK